MSELKPFQQATVDAALRAFRANRRIRRFLVADEVGLGKTVVARGVIEGLMSRRDRELVVFYVCSNLTIAAQNRRRLLEVLPTKAEREAAVCPVDRLTLAPSSVKPTHKKLHLYTLTPDTSLPMRGGRRRDGRMDERALIHCVVEKLWPGYLEDDPAIFRFGASTNWGRSIDIQRESLEKRIRDKSFSLQNFKDCVRDQLRLDAGQQVLSRLRKLEALDVVAQLRNALAASAIGDLKPDLIIFDEFQRFLDLLISNPDGEEAQEDPAARVLRGLRGESSHSGALLLLSATPYRLFARRGEVQEDNSHQEFFQIVEFLYGGNSAKRKACENAFTELRAALLKGKAGLEELASARIKAEDLLTPIMSRTERRVPLRMQFDGSLKLGTTLEDGDLKVFKHLSNSFLEAHKTDAVTYWTSVPLPMQSMGAGYVAWNEAREHLNANRARGVPALNARHISGKDSNFTPIPRAHPKLRALLENLAKPENLALPWIAPSLPWWPLSKKWQLSLPEKRLLFSRFRAVPGTVASLLSYELEAHMMAAETLAYADLTKRKPFGARRDWPLLLAQFHTSPWLATVSDPLRVLEGPRSSLKKRIEQQIRDALKELDIPVRSGLERRPFWQLLAQIEAQKGVWHLSNAAWRRVAAKSASDDPQESSTILLHLVQQWNEAASKPVGAVSEKEVADLAEYALQAPGIVWARAILRHWPEMFHSVDNLESVLRGSWDGLRNYLGQMIFVKALDSNDKSYSDAVRRAIFEGNFESVLDEHLWISTKLNGLSGVALAQHVGEALRLRISNHTYHSLTSKEANFKLRCHAAMPFGEVRTQKTSDIEGEVVRLRTEDLLKSFNSPFWPYVLITTSLGQEGLDFHTWCQSLVHWDLSGSPVDMEQREGRIQRYGGLSIRRAISTRLGKDALAMLGADSSPWSHLERLADERLSDMSGLRPWWICEGGEIKRYTFEIPTSEQKEKYLWLRTQRLLYRLAIGSPDQEDLLELLAAQQRSPEEIEAGVIQLSAFFRERKANEG